MARIVAGFILLLTVGTVHGMTVSTKVTPVEKVMELMKKLMAQTAEEGKVEAKDYDKAACYCKEQADDKLYAIEKSTEKLGKLAAKISKLESEIATLNGEITDLSKQMTELEDTIKEISDTRAKEHSDYLVEAADIAGAIESMEGAIKALEDAKEGQEGDVKTMLLQEMASRVLKVSARSNALTPTEQEQRLLGMLQAEADAEEPGEAQGYQYKSNAITATLKTMKKTFKENKVDLDNMEFQTKAAFEKKRLGLQNEHQFAEEDKNEKTALVESKEEELAADKEDEAEETKAKKADDDFLKALTEQCEQKAKTFDQRSKARSDELTALSKALGSLEGIFAQISAKPIKSQVSFLQLSEAPQGQVPEKVLSLLATAAGALHSRNLVALTMRARLNKDHFVKVRQMIKDLIAKLKAEAKAEAETKGFCDREMAEAITNRDEANMIIEETTATTSKLTAEKASLESDNEQLSKEIAENMKGLKEAQEVRNAENAANMQSIADAKAGKDGVTFAIDTLKEFYEGGSFIQTKSSTQTKSSDKEPYAGNQSAATGILGLLEVILSDFERTIETTETKEDEAQTEFDDFEKESNEDTEAKEDEITTKKGRISEIDDTLMKTEEDHGDAKEQLETALAGLEKIKPMCVPAGPTYEEKVAKREQEIAALKEAMQILIDWQGF